VAASGERRPRWRGLLRGRGARYLFLLGLGILIWRILAGQPVQVDVTYHYGAARRGLRSAQMRYLQGGEEVRRVRFDYARRGVGREQHHQVRLLRGDYTVEVELNYQGPIPPPLRGAGVDPPRGREGTAAVIRLERPLLIKGGGEAAVFVVGDR
jgi:hypothetical protein